MKKVTTVNEYIARFPRNVQAILRKVRGIVKKAAPKAEEGIMYGMVGYKLSKKPLVYFGGWKNHLGFYATPTGHAKFKKDLAKYANAKGSVTFPFAEKIPYVLIGKMVKFRVKQNLVQ